MANKTVRKTLTAPVISSDELPRDLRKAAEGEDIDKWFYASVEVPDHEKDIIRVAGIDTKKYAQNGGAIKFISNHNRAAGPDGRLPVIGKTVKWVPTRHVPTGMPAMAVAVKFAPTELGQEMRKLYDGGFLTDVSIGAEALKGKPIENGGIDYEQVAIAELSACINGMNQFAGVVRALDDEFEKANSLNSAGVAHARSLISAGKVNHGAWVAPDDAERKTMGEDMFMGADRKYPFGKGGELYASALHAIVSRANANGDTAIGHAASGCIEMLNSAKALTLSEADLLKFHEPLNDRHKELLTAMADFKKQITSRLDDLEDTISSLPKGADPQDERKDQQSKGIDLDKLRSLLNRL